MKAHPTKQYKDNYLQSSDQIIRVGNDVYEIVINVDADGNKFQELQPRNRVVIKERFGNLFLSSTPYYDGFANLPSHISYRRIIDNGQNGLYNKYHPIDYNIIPGEHPTWNKLISHIGGEQVDLLWDYLRILWQRPTQVLPVLCLISKTNETGKSTFGNALTYLFGHNARTLGEKDLANDFNFWVSGLIAIFEEISSTKKTINIIKNFSTAKRATINEKNVRQYSIDCFLKILIFSNTEDDFLKANKEDIRYWIIQLPKLKDFDPNFDSKLRNEAPYIAYTLTHSKIQTECRSRMWFAPDLIATDALQNVVMNSRSDCAKSLEIWIEDKLSEIGEFYATASEICEILGRRYSPSEIANALKKELNYPTPNRGYYTPINGQARKQGRAYHFKSCDTESNDAVLNVLNGGDPNDPYLPF